MLRSQTDQQVLCITNRSAETRISFVSSSHRIVTSQLADPQRSFSPSSPQLPRKHISHSLNGFWSKGFHVITAVSPLDKRFPAFAVITCRAHGTQHYTGRKTPPFPRSQRATTTQCSRGALTPRLGHASSQEVTLRPLLCGSVTKRNAFSLRRLESPRATPPAAQSDGAPLHSVNAAHKPTYTHSAPSAPKGDCLFNTRHGAPQVFGP